MIPRDLLSPVLLAVVLTLGAASPAAAQGPLQRVLQPAGEAGEAGGAGEAEGEGAAAEPAAPEDPGAAQTPPADEEPPPILPEAPPRSPLLDEDVLEASFWLELARDLRDRLIAWVPSLVAALLVLAVFLLIYRVTAGLLRRVMERARVDKSAQQITLRLARFAVLALGLVMAASQLGIEVASLITGLGIIGLAVGLAAQDSLGNLIAGLTILWDRPFRIGDNVTVAGTFGQVKEIGLRSTRIRTVEQLDAILPNKDIINQKIVNHTLNPQFRLPIPIGIAYKEDSRQARRVLLAAVEGHPLILEQPPPRVVMLRLGESSVDLELRVWLRDPHAEREALVELTELAKIALDEAGIEIPFPQRTLHFAEPPPWRDGNEGQARPEPAAPAPAAPAPSEREPDEPDTV